MSRRALWVQTTSHVGPGWARESSNRDRVEARCNLRICGLKPKVLLPLGNPKDPTVLKIPLISEVSKIGGPQKGPAERGHVKKRQKSSKSAKNIFDIFRAGQKTSKIVKKCQKVFRHFLTIFAWHPFSGPFWGAPGKGVGGRGLATTKPPKTAKGTSPVICPPSHKGGILKWVQERGLDLWHWKDFFAATPSDRQPLFETSDYLHIRFGGEPIVLSRQNFPRVDFGQKVALPFLVDFFLPAQRARRGILMPRGKNCRETIFAAQLPRN